MFDFFGDGNSFSLKTLNAELSKAGKAKEITIHINSGGGLVSEGFAIYDKLRVVAATGVKISTIVEGMCGSIATVIAQAADKGNRKMFQNSEYFIHNPLWIPSGPDAHTADDLEKLTDELRKNEEKLIDFYVARTSASREVLAEKMKVETTLTAQEAQELGFIDEVINTNVVAMVKYKIAAAVKPVNNQTNIMEATEIKSGFERLEKLFNKIIKRVVNATVKTTEGVDIYFDGTLQEGTQVWLDEAMTQPAPNGVHTYEGKLYTVENGVVVKVEDAAPVNAELDAAKAEIENLKAQLQAATEGATTAKQENEQLVNQINEIKTEFVNFKQKIQTGLGQDFEAFVIDGKTPAPKKSLMEQVAEMRKAKSN